MQEFLSRENVARGTLFFLLCTFAGLFLSFLWGDTQNIKQVFREIQVELLLGACLCMFADWVFGALRFHIFVQKLKPDIRFWDSLRANLATLCVSCITPFQTGGVGHLYIYARAGVPLSGSITSSIICFLSTLTTLFFFAVGIAWLDPPFLPKRATWVSLFSCLMFGLVFIGFLLLLFKPELVFRFFHWLCNVAQRRFTRLTPILDRATLKVEELVVEHKSFAVMFLRSHKWTCAFSSTLNLRFLRSTDHWQLHSRESTQRGYYPMGTQRCWVAAKFRRTLRTQPWGKWGCRDCNRRVNGKFDSQRIDTSLCVADAIFRYLLCCCCWRYCY
jgi:uncharacterized membrane protein YbhN (UPF0104 family)